MENKKIQNLLNEMDKVDKVLIKNTWDEDEEYTRSDWKFAVTNEDTQLGYWDWVEHTKELYEE